MLTAEYDYDTDIEVQREEAFTEGHKEGFDKIGLQFMSFRPLHFFPDGIQNLLFPKISHS